MTDESDPYAAVIADLERKRDDLDETIRRLKALRAGGAAVPMKPGGDAAAKTEDIGEVDADNPFLGMSIVDATKALLGKKRKMMRTADIVERLEAGGLMLSGASKVNTVGSVLNRRQRQVGDIVSPKRGHWGLKDWYPGRNFGKKQGDSNGGAGDASDSSELEQPSEQPQIVPLRSSETP